MDPPLTRPAVLAGLPGGVAGVACEAVGLLCVVPCGVSGVAMELYWCVPARTLVETYSEVDNEWPLPLGFLKCNFTFRYTMICCCLAFGL